MYKLIILFALSTTLSAYTPQQVRELKHLQHEGRSLAERIEKQETLLKSLVTKSDKLKLEDSKIKAGFVKEEVGKSSKASHYRQQALSNRAKLNTLYQKTNRSDQSMATRKLGEMRLEYTGLVLKFKRLKEQWK